MVIDGNIRHRAILARPDRFLKPARSATAQCHPKPQRAELAAAVCPQVKNSLRSAFTHKPMTLRRATSKQFLDLWSAYSSTDTTGESV